MGNGFFLVLLAMFGFMYFMLIRPQRQRERKRVEMLGNIKVGDEIITAGGIYGEVVQLDNDRVMLEIDNDVRVAVARNAISGIVPPEELERLEALDTESERDDGVTVEEPLTAEERTTRS